ncbi:MAG UNVERIFIED_CONTAM: replication-associated recombination protein A, partial [Thermobifida fusca]
YRGAADLGHGVGYRYPHDHPGGVVAQRHLPEEVDGVEYYRPTTHGAERRFGEVLRRIKGVLRGGSH